MKTLVSLGGEFYEAALRWKRYLAYLAVAVGVLLLAASLSTRELPVTIVLFTAGLQGPEQVQLADQLSMLGGAVKVREGALDPYVIRAENAGFAIAVRDNQRIAVVNDTATDQPHAQALANSALHLLSGNMTNPVTLMAVQTTWVEPERLSALPRPQEWNYIPRVVALLSVFASFLIAFESYLRHAGSAHLGVVLAARNGLGHYLGAKLIWATLAGMCTLAVLLLTANAIYGLAPKAGLAEVVIIYALAALVSAMLGLTAAMLTGPTRQALASIVAYFFALIAFSGFIVPLAGAAPWVQYSSYALPLRFPLAVIEQWLNRGQAVDVGRAIEDVTSALAGRAALSAMAIELLVFLGLLPVALLLLWGAARRARSNF